MGINLRRDAVKQLLDAMGVNRAADEFGYRAVSKIRSLVDEGERPVGLGGAGLDTSRIFSFIEYDVHLEAPTHTTEIGGSSNPFHGHIFSESGYNSFSPAGRVTSMLHAFRLPNSAHVDRTLCAEFQLLGELCAIFSPGGIGPRSDVVGVVSLFTTSSPCMSCLGAIRQFQILFPEVDVETCEYDD